MKVYIDYSDFGLDLKLWIIDDKSERRKKLNYINGEWEVKDIEEGMYDPIPSLHFRGRLGEEVMQAMTNAFAERGFKPENENKVHGKLEATEKHLEDMRTLLKLRKP